MQIAPQDRLRVLFVPDSIYWVTGTIAKSIARFNPWIHPTIVSGPVLSAVFDENPEIIRNFDLVHFTCPYASQEWLPRFRDHVACVTSHHHVTDWEWIKHNLAGDAIVVGSTQWAEDLRQRGADMSKVFCVPYGVDADVFQPPIRDERSTLRQKLGIPRNAIAVGFFGKNSSNDEDRKGIDVFTEAARRLGQALPALFVLLVGPGWQELRDSLKSTGVECLWVPFVYDTAGLARMYKTLDFYWVTARVEGGPVTLLEGMSAGVCCLTTPVGIAREVVNDQENGFILPFNDSQAFVERTLSLASDAKTRTRIGKSARRSIVETMSVSQTSQLVRNVYSRALENRAIRRGSVIDFSPITNSGAIASGEQRENTVPLHGLPRPIQKQVKMLETLKWGEHMIARHQQRGLALRMMLGEWMRNPMSLQPVRAMMRSLLPVGVVSRLVRIKNAGRMTPVSANNGVDL